MSMPRNQAEVFNLSRLGIRRIEEAEVDETLIPRRWYVVCWQDVGGLTRSDRWNSAVRAAVEPPLDRRS